MKRRDFLRTAGMVTAGSGLLIGTGGPVSYTHLTLPTTTSV